MDSFICNTLLNPNLHHTNIYGLHYFYHIQYNHLFWNCPYILYRCYDKLNTTSLLLENMFNLDKFINIILMHHYFNHKSIYIMKNLICYKKCNLLEKIDYKLNMWYHNQNINYSTKTKKLNNLASIFHLWYRNNIYLLYLNHK